MYPEAITRIHAIPIPSLQPKPSVTRGITVHLTVATAHPHRRRFEISAVSRRTSAVSRSTAVKASSAGEDFVKKTAASHDIVIFSKTYCPYCRRAKAVFEQLNMVPYVVELDQREDGDDIQDALDKVVGRRTVPQVFINGNHLGGSDDTVEAYESGRLVEILGIDANVDL